MRIGTATLTVLALLAFAANSLLCRMALRTEMIDAISFTQARLASGAVILAPILAAHLRGARFVINARNISAAFALFLYAIGFSLAYLRLPAGTGALILFGAVQVTMIGYGVARGQRPSTTQWMGIAAALAGLSYLFAPGIAAPPLAFAVLMGLAGAAWGAYSLLGRGEANPVAATARNFALALPFAVLLFAVPAPRHLTFEGVALAVASGAVASGAGYVIWYRALQGLSPVVAAVVQLAVPVIAALGGVALLAEPMTARLAIAAALILGGIFAATVAQKGDPK
ncbi:MAG: DMT family transporter [Pseudomonadota bacterium]|nr:DMT family transporter [Pseudomonadota bacterium]